MFSHGDFTLALIFCMTYFVIHNSNSPAEISLTGMKKSSRKHRTIPQTHSAINHCQVLCFGDIVYLHLTGLSERGLFVFTHVDYAKSTGITHADSCQIFSAFKSVRGGTGENV